MSTLIIDQFTTPPSLFHVLILEGQSQYGANNRFALDLDQALQARGHQVTRAHFDDATFNDVIINALQGGGTPLSLIISFNGIAKELTINDTPLSQLLNIPCINYFVDHPMKQYSRADLPIEQHINTYVDEAHVGFAKQFLSQHFNGLSGCLKHAGVQLKSAKKPIAYEKRDHQILVAGSYKPFDACWADLTFEGTPVLTQLLQTIVEAQIDDPETPMGSRFLSAFEQAGMNTALLDNTLLLQLFLRVERAVEMHFRGGFIQAAEDLPLLIAGNGWEKFKKPSKAWQMVGAQQFDWLLEKIQQVKLVWSQVYCFTQGGHERIFYAQANGTAVACDDMPWLRETYDDEKEALLIAPNDFTAGVEKIGYWLNEQPTKKLEALAKGGQAVCLANHTWQHRVLEIESWVEQYTAYQTLLHPKEYGVF
ncbi:MAG: glycosyltransferase family 1 protein [Vampirovibrio sp.]|nr:glycosyltransferase family 1 protein [Vampirovibrio sp.]